MPVFVKINNIFLPYQKWLECPFVIEKNQNKKGSNSTSLVNLSTCDKIHWMIVFILAKETTFCLILSLEGTRDKLSPCVNAIITY
jgi:hypothetical protein